MADEKDRAAQLEAHRGDERFALIEDDFSDPLGGDAKLRDNVRGMAPTEEELQRPYVAPGEKALLPVGVVYQADWQPFADGMARHARSQASALARAGIPVKLETISTGGRVLDSEVHAEARRQVQHLQSLNFDRVALAVRQAVLHTPDFTRSLVLPAGARLVDLDLADRMCKHTVVYTSWERDRVPVGIVEILNRCGEVWVPCHANKRAFEDSGVERVGVVPYPYEPGVGASSIPAPYGTEKAPEGRRYYSIGKWEPRKDQMRLLRAFLLAFSPRQFVSLVIKTSNYGRWVSKVTDDMNVVQVVEYPTMEEALQVIGTDPAVLARGWDQRSLALKVRIITDRLSDDEIVDLHRQNNIYVSVSHGEAWDLPAFDARCAGNRLVHVGYGGSGDYAGADDVPIAYHMAPVHQAYGWESDARWAEYRDEDLVDALRAAKPPTRRVHPPDFNGRFSAHAVGEMMSQRLWELGYAQDGKQWPKLWDEMMENSYG